MYVKFTLPDIRYVGFPRLNFFGITVSENYPPIFTTADQHAQNNLMQSMSISCFCFFERDHLLFCEYQNSNLLLMKFKLMLCKPISRGCSNSAYVARKNNPTDVIGFNVTCHVLELSFCSTHFANP